MESLSHVITLEQSLTLYFKVPGNRLVVVAAFLLVNFDCFMTQVVIPIPAIPGNVTRTIVGALFFTLMSAMQISWLRFKPAGRWRFRMCLDPL
mmetsp:Transcript_32475/g.102971  ORF Transcript_32475/g.102971 Transcript_32475/m.102971 type:complete len:93 (-) Transcript_32475:67-345(-)